MIKNIIFTIAVLLTLTACNTVAGIGQDVKAAGQGVSNAAHSVQNAM
ncbi:MAG: entericidin A/B family lipoprotein [Neisseriaceae bacterium]|nr:entericidin A/B family lipoprotein [Neisseriaceae bacterium]